jgi:hypothetical protein
MASSFAFVGNARHYTARMESRPDGHIFWYASLGNEKKLAKKFLGKTREVTVGRLEQAELFLTQQ